MDETRRTDDWKGEEWAGEDPTPSADNPPAEHWNKTQWVGDHGEGAPEPQDPATMPEGETSISGNRHTPGEEHWVPGDGTGTARGAETTPR